MLTFCTDISDVETEIVLDANQDNYDILHENDNKVVNVKINNLTLKKDGSWQAIYLPFDNMDIENSILKGADVRKRGNGSFEGKVFTIDFTEPVTTISRGYPYIIRWQGGNDIVNPVFINVRISNYYDYSGAIWGFEGKGYLPFTVEEGAEIYRQVTGGPILSPITTGTTYHAFEPFFFFIPSFYEDIDYFIMDTGEEDDLITGIKEIANSSKEAGDEVIYNLSGQRLSKQMKGINIVNGQKVIKK